MPVHWKGPTEVLEIPEDSSVDFSPHTHNSQGSQFWAPFVILTTSHWDPYGQGSNFKNPQPSAQSNMALCKHWNGMVDPLGWIPLPPGWGDPSSGVRRPSFVSQLPALGKILPANPALGPLLSPPQGTALASHSPSQTLQEIKFFSHILHCQARAGQASWGSSRCTKVRSRQRPKRRNTAKRMAGPEGEHLPQVGTSWSINEVSTGPRGRQQPYL